MWTAPAGAALPFGDSLKLTASVRPTVLDYELPGHPTKVGAGHVGAVGDLGLVWQYDRHVAVRLGVRGRLPFALDFPEEAAARPTFAVELMPFGDIALMRFGTLDHDHGFHPAVLDEARYRYGRPIEDTYNASIPAEAHRDLMDLAMPMENGGQVILQYGDVRSEVYVDWQLLETAEHREKFAVGVLGEYAGKWVEASFQYRLVHYGGQRFTQRDPIRASGLDPKRQPTTLAVTLTPKPLHLSWLQVGLPLAFINGRVIQTPGARETRHYGFEVGVDATMFELVTLGYRLWLPDGGLAASVSEDGEPVYAGPRSHRARVGLSQQVGPAKLEGRLDLVFQEGADKVQYLTVTTVTVAWETLLFSDAPLP
ncbi:MAG: hypothetical protein H6730_16520 [Deltaproteobacteria bacterium]|nr:hypothetical protein [Deltaproteobacteria bacterium]